MSIHAGPDDTGETILYADLDRHSLVRAKYDFDVAGHDARPDLFKLLVDTRPQRAVSMLTESAEAAVGA